MAGDESGREEGIRQLKELLLEMARRYLIAQQAYLSQDPNLTKQELWVIQIMAWLGLRTVGEISRVGGMPDSTASWVVNRLVEKGYLSRRRSERDRRVVELELTGPSAALMAAMEDAYQRMATALWDEMTPRGREVTMEVLRRVVDAAAAQLPESGAETHPKHSGRRHSDEK